MKTKNAIAFLTSLLLIIGNNLMAQPDTNPDYQSIADKIVNHSLKIEPGEVVIINGTPNEIDLLKELVVAVSKAGGNATVELNIPEANREALMETPVEYLKQEPKYQLWQVKNVDAFINTGSVQDPGLFADVPEEKLAVARKAFEPLTEASQKEDFRSVALGQTGGIPTPAYAEYKGADYDKMMDMFWKSLDTDYASMLSTGKSITQIMKPGNTVNLTTDAGTDLTFKIGDVEPRINSGKTAETQSSAGPAQVWLPAGEAYVTVDPSSANGTLVVPEFPFRGTPVKNLTITFENGKITSMEGDENVDAVKKSVEVSTGDKDVLSVVDIGLNPNSHPIENYHSWEMGGMVTLGIGNNLWAGGNVKSDNSMSFHIPNATLSIDGQEVVANGELKKVTMTKK